MRHKPFPSAAVRGVTAKEPSTGYTLAETSQSRQRGGRA
jgi:hypothetical protein